MTTVYEEVAEIREEMSKANIDISLPRGASELVRQSPVIKAYYAMVKILDKHTFAAVKQYCREERIPVPMYDVFNPLPSVCCSSEDWREIKKR